MKPMKPIKPRLVVYFDPDDQSALVQEVDEDNPELPVVKPKIKKREGQDVRGQIDGEEN